MLITVLLGTLLCGNTVLAMTEYPQQDEENGNRILPINAEELLVGDYISWVPDMIIPDGYTFYVNNYLYNKEDIFSLAAEGLRGVLVKSYEKNDEGKTIRITTAGARSVTMPVKEGFRHVFTEYGNMVTCTLPEWIDKAEFQAWQVIEQQYWQEDGGYPRMVDISAELGLTQEDLQQESISFIMTHEHINPMSIYIIKKDGNTVSGNVAVPEVPQDSQGEDSSSKSSAGTGNNDVQGNAVIQNQVHSSDGKVLTSSAQMSYHANSIEGAAVVTPQKEVDTAAGLSAEDISKKVNAKFYIGDVYDKEVKALLNSAVGQTGGTITSMVNVDLYTITWSGKINRVRNTIDEKNVVSMIFGIPDYLLKEGRSFSLVGVRDGKVIEIVDTDSDPKTITADLSYFGPYAIVYK